MRADARLPGLYFQEPKPAPDYWPRMDVAGFCGFVGQDSRPADQRYKPVVIEDAAGFERMFGADVLLCLDATGAPVKGLLGPAVRTFFAQGGRRCHVVGVPVPNSFNAAALADPLLLEATIGGVANALDGARQLEGLHALATVEEVSLLALPDAVLAGWTEEEPPTPPAPLASAAPPPPSPSLFRMCDLAHLSKPRLALTAPGRLEWSAPGAPSFELQLAEDPAWSDAKTVLAGAVNALLLPAVSTPRYARVRARDGDRASVWSDGVLLPGTAHNLRREVPAHAFQSASMLALHRALLRLCAARGDAFALLSLPRHYDEAAAISHATLLGDLKDIEAPALSFGALYHPWVAFAGQGEVAPDGPACGAIARRTISRGAWLAPAGEAWPNAIALVPRALNAERLNALQQAGINVLRPTARGIMPLAATTLAIDEDLRPIGVRRLLTLLRRIVLREGLEWIFEPNGEVLHRALQRRFEALMAELFARGAFSPARSAEAFQVTVDATGAEKGQLVIELRVAPSRPLAFLLVRLLRTGDRLTLEES